MKPPATAKALQWVFLSLSSAFGDQYRTKCRVWTDWWTLVHVPTYKVVGDGGSLPSDAWNTPDQGVQLEGEGDPDSIWPVQVWDLSNNTISSCFEPLTWHLLVFQLHSNARLWRREYNEQWSSLPMQAISVLVNVLTPHQCKHWKQYPGNFILPIFTKEKEKLMLILLFDILIAPKSTPCTRAN
jgi:hypothetical protein